LKMKEVSGYVLVWDSYGKVQLIGKPSVPGISYQSIESNGIRPFDDWREPRAVMAEIVAGRRDALFWKQPDNMASAFFQLRVAENNDDLRAFARWNKFRFTVILTNGEGDQLLGAVNPKFSGEPIFEGCGPLSEKAVLFDSFVLAEEIATRASGMAHGKVAIASLGLRLE
jgi:hypothetical protein